MSENDHTPVAQESQAIGEDHSVQISHYQGNKKQIYL